jgi:hypothetical protein
MDGQMDVEMGSNDCSMVLKVYSDIWEKILDYLHQRVKLYPLAN